MHYLQHDTNATNTIHDITVRYDCISRTKRVNRNTFLFNCKIFTCSNKTAIEQSHGLVNILSVFLN